jgi:hypothetical protein
VNSSVRRYNPGKDAKFGWLLTVTGIPAGCAILRWEQFVTGGFTIHFSDGSSKSFDAPAVMRRINPKARRFGRWSDDMLPGMKPGPRKVEAYPYASCTGSVNRRSSRGSMRGPSANPVGPRYEFDDAPGFPKNFGEMISGKVFTGISWDTGFEHKLWRSGEGIPFFTTRFHLTGRYSQDGTDTRVIR